MNKEKAINEIKYAKSFGTSGIVPRWEAIDTVLNYIEELEEENTNAKYQYDLGYKACEIEFTNKIRDKIKELENLIKEAHKELGSASKEFTIYVSQEKILKELLEEEI